MNPFSMVVCIVLIVCVTAVWEKMVKQRTNLLEKRMLGSDATDERFRKIEQRLANLETIMLEREKHREYERL